MIKVSKQKRERSRAECEKKQKRMISNIYALCNINDHVTLGCSINYVNQNIVKSHIKIYY